MFCVCTEKNMEYKTLIDVTRNAIKALRDYDKAKEWQEAKRLEILRRKALQGKHDLRNMDSARSAFELARKATREAKHRLEIARLEEEVKRNETGISPRLFLMGKNELPNKPSVLCNDCPRGVDFKFNQHENISALEFGYQIRKHVKIYRDIQLHYCQAHYELMPRRRFCGLCNFTCRTDEEIMQHLNGRHSGWRNSGGVPYCHLCGEMFRDVIVLSTHVGCWHPWA